VLEEGEEGEEEEEESDVVRELLSTHSAWLGRDQARSARQARDDGNAPGDADRRKLGEARDQAPGAK
jgi:hypothetical protein